MHTFLSSLQTTAGTGFRVKRLTQSLCQCLDDDGYDGEWQQQQQANPFKQYTAFCTHICSSSNNCICVFSSLPGHLSYPLLFVRHVNGSKSYGVQ